MQWRCLRWRVSAHNSAQIVFFLVVAVQMVGLAQRIIVPMVGRMIRHKKYVRAAQQVAVTVRVIIARRTARATQLLPLMIVMYITQIQPILASAIAKCRSYNMRRSIIIPLVGAFVCGAANAACTATTKTYTSCKPGYYLSGGTCQSCPSGGTSADKNTGGVTACYLPSGTTGSDSTGSYTYTANCYYSN